MSRRGDFKEKQNKRIVDEYIYGNVCISVTLIDLVIVLDFGQWSLGGVK